MEKLKDRIISHYGTQKNFANWLGVSESAVTRYLNGERPWKAKAIFRAAELLKIPDGEIRDYFFADTIAERREVKK